eukprot:PhM_4_TR9049/c0_g1_i1/m.9060/K03259/EIF4E; translation initiation factor 4E
MSTTTSTAAPAPPEQSLADDLKAPKTRQSHPLEETWVLWYNHRKIAHTNVSQWEDILTQLTEASTVEEFWSTYNNIKRPSSLEFGSDYHMFRRGVKPAWEDPANIQGGKWQLSIGPKEETRLDTLWEKLLLSMIGETLIDDALLEQFPEIYHNKVIVGTVMSRRRNNTRITVWTNDSTNEAMLLAIGRRLKEVLNVTDLTLEFSAHNAARATGAKDGVTMVVETSAPPLRV